MFRTLFKKRPTLVPDKTPISLSLEFVGFDSDGNGATIRWDATGVPDDVVFDVDFKGHPSGVITGFVWDTHKPTLDHVFVCTGDRAYIITVAWAYSGCATDGSSNVSAAWSCNTKTRFELAFDAGSRVHLELEFDADQKTVRAV